MSAAALNPSPSAAANGSGSSSASSSDHHVRMEYYKAEGNAAYTARRFTAAVTAYSRALVASYPLLPSQSTSRDAALDTFCATLHSNRAAAWMGLRRWSDARADCTRALQLAPAMEKARTRLATIDKEAAKHEAGAAASAASSAADTAAMTDFTFVHSLPAQSPSPRLEVRANLPHGKHNGLFVAAAKSSDADGTAVKSDDATAPSAFQPGELLFECPAAAVVLDADCAGGQRDSVDLLYELLISATLDARVARSLASLYPCTDEQLLSLPIVSLDQSAPEEADEYQLRVADASNDVGTHGHPALLVPRFERLSALCCGRIEPKQILLLHHQVLYNSFDLGGGSAGGADTGTQPRAGAALYPAASLLNHSCWPNACMAVLHGSEERVSVRALRTIAPGEEVTVAYPGIALASQTRGARRRQLAQVHEFLCQCDRCYGEGEGAKADELLEAIRCINVSCEGFEASATRGQRGTMYRRRPQHASKEEAEAERAEARDLFAQTGEFVPDDTEDTFECNACGSRVPAVGGEVEQLVQGLTDQLAQVRAEYSSATAASATTAGGSDEELQRAIAAFTSLLNRAEAALHAPTHWLLPQLYSALAGLHFQHSRVLLRSTHTRALQSSSREAAEGVAAAGEAESSAALASSHRLASLSYHASVRVLPPHHLLLVSLLLTCAAVVPPTHPTRMSCMQEALRIHGLSYGGGLQLLRDRYPRDFERIQLPQHVIAQMQTPGAQVE